MTEYPWSIEWARRQELAAKVIRNNSSVLDLGGGQNNIRRKINYRSYTSIDLEKWTDFTVVADLNKEFPDLGSFDYILSLGLVEYLTDPRDFLSKIQKYGDTLVISYRLNSNGPMERSNHLTFSEFEEILGERWRIIQVVVINKIEKLYVCENRMKIRAFWYDGEANVGDLLTKPILEHWGFKVSLAPRNSRGKLLGVGSIMRALRKHDVVWGSGCIQDQRIIAPGNNRFLAVRGPLTKSLIDGAEIPDVFGDPGLLMPLIYNPHVTKKYKIGIIPHYVDKTIAPVGDYYFIDVQKDYKTVITGIKSCETIISSSLHGIILAEAYGCKAVWAKYSDKIIGGEFKFQDYFLGTGRSRQKLGAIAPLTNLDKIQKRLIKALGEL